MDIKAIIDGVIAGLQQVGLVSDDAKTVKPIEAATAASPTVLERIGQMLPDQQTLIMLLIVVGLTALIWKSSFGRRARAGAEEAMFSNWRLALLGATALVLSLASGWTTWDGMRNFTGEPLLSLMITFGIQGVMLIAAWLIGESFATGMNRSGRTADGVAITPAQTIAGAALGILFFIAVVGLALSWTGILSAKDISLSNPGSWASSDRLIFVIMGLIVIAAVLLTQQDVIGPYLKGSTVILRNMVLWVMFLACMATSVFFSFDSLFSVIFPKDERKRAADIRAITQVSAVVADIGTLISSRRIEQAEVLFQSKGWKGYEAELEKVAALGRKAPDKVREQMEQELRKRARRLAELQEKKASAKSGQAGLTTRKIQLTEEYARLRAARPEAAQTAAQQKAVVTSVERELDEQRAKVLAEEKGVEGSGKVGRGKFWRAARAEETKIKSRLQVARKRLAGYQSRLDKLSSRIAAVRRQLAEIDGEIAKYTGEAETINRMISVAKTDNTNQVALTTNPITIVAQLTRQREDFRLDPREKKLLAIQEKCQLLLTTSQRVASLRNEAAAIDCDPKQASAAAAAVFALNVGLTTFNTNCAGGDKVPQSGGTDAMLRFGRKCLQDSGLPSKDTAAIGAKLSSIDLSRDDKAHRFVVTWNAFSDGNRLAFLALAIAIAIDSLVFMSGIFGANAIRSPLSDVPTNKARSARQLEAIIDAALMPHSFETARLVLGDMRPMTHKDGFMAQIHVHNDDPHAAEIRRVLNAGTTIGAVRHVDDREHVYEIRSELFEYLSQVAKREFESNEEHADLAAMVREIGYALLPKESVAANAEMILSHMHPIERKNDFIALVNLDDIDQSHKRTVLNALNAGTMFDRVQPYNEDNPNLFQVHQDFYKTLIRLRASRSLHHEQPAGVPRLEADQKPLLTSEPASSADERKQLSAPVPVSPQTNEARSQVEPDSNPARREFFDSYQDIPMAFERQLRMQRIDLFDALSSTHKRIAEGLNEHLSAIQNQLPKEIAVLETGIHGHINEAIKDAKADRQTSLRPHQIDQLATEIRAIVPLILLREDGEYEGMLARLRQRIFEEPPKHATSAELRDWLSILDEHAENLQKISRREPEDWRRVSDELERFSDEISSANEISDDPDDGGTRRYAS